MKTVTQVTVGGIAALAIAFAAFRVGAYFEDRAVIRCVAEVQQKIREDDETFPKRAADWTAKMLETGLDETKAGPQPTPNFKGPAARLEALTACEGSRIFVLR